MEFLYLLEKIRLPGLNEIMLGITYLGDELAFLIIVMVVFWCVDKRRGYYVLTAGYFGTLLSQFLKILCCVPRPWVRDPNFTILEQAREGAGGFSFPSGHSQTAVTTFGSIAVTARNKLMRWACIAVCILVPFTRMYIGVHTPADVLAGMAIGVFLLAVLHPVIFRKDGKYIPYLLGVMVVLAGAYMTFLYVHTFPAEVYLPDPNTGVTPWFSAAKNAYTLMGTLVGFLIVYTVDEKWLHFPVKAVWWAQLLKLVLGFGLVLAVKEGMRAPLEALCGAWFSAENAELAELVARTIRYFMVVITAGTVWPLTFRWFAKLGKKG